MKIERNVTNTNTVTNTTFVFGWNILEIAQFCESNAYKSALTNIRKCYKECVW